MTKRTEIAAVTIGFACLAIATTYPLVLVVGTHLPSDLGDPLLNAWTLAWDASRIPHGLAGLWDAPNFLSRFDRWDAYLLLVAAFVLIAPVFQHLVLNARSARTMAWGNALLYLAIFVQLTTPAAFLVANEMRMQQFRAQMENDRRHGMAVKSGEVAGLLRGLPPGTFTAYQALDGLEHSELIRADVALVDADRSALLALVSHDDDPGAHAYWQIESKLIWDTLQSGKVADALSRGPVAEALLVKRSSGTLAMLLPRLLDDYIAPYAPARLCDGGRMRDDDLHALDLLYANIGEAERIRQAGLQSAPSSGNSDWKTHRQRLTDVCSAGPRRAG